MKKILLLLLFIKFSSMSFAGLFPSKKQAQEFISTKLYVVTPFTSE